MSERAQDVSGRGPRTFTCEHFKVPVHDRHHAAYEHRRNCVSGQGEVGGITRRAIGWWLVITRRAIDGWLELVSKK